MFRSKTAEHYIMVYCDYSDAEIINSEIALEAPHTLGRLVDHAGELPQGSGFCHDVLVGRIDRMRTIHKDYDKSYQLMRLLTKKQAWCCIAWGYLLDRKPEGAEKPLKSVKLIAEHLGINYDCFKKTRKNGIDRINAELGFLIA